MLKYASNDRHHHRYANSITVPHIPHEFVYKYSICRRRGLHVLYSALQWTIFVIVIAWFRRHMHKRAPGLPSDALHHVPTESKTNSDQLSNCLYSKFKPNILQRFWHQNDNSFVQTRKWVSLSNWPPHALHTHTHTHQHKHTPTNRFFILKYK